MTSSSSSNENLTRRLFSELGRLLETGHNCGIVDVETSDSNLLFWTVKIRGPERTAFEAGTFSVQLSFPENYPAKPPRVKFLTKIFHPNVHEDGTLCLEILGADWRPSCDASLILSSLRDFLNAPNALSPANLRAAMLYLHDPQQYDDRVRRLVAANGNAEAENEIYYGDIDLTSAGLDIGFVGLENVAITRESVAKIRLNQDFAALKKCPPDGFYEVLLNPHDFTLNGLFEAPTGSKFDSEKVQFSVKFSPDYPHGSVEVVFPTKPFHPNVSVDGRADSQLFNDWQTRARHHHHHQGRLATLLASIRTLFQQPNSNYITNPSAAIEFGMRRPKQLSDAVKARLADEFHAAAADNVPAGISAGPTTCQDDMWQAIVVGPDGSAFEGNLYNLLIEIPANYPMEAPEVRFISEISLSNVDVNGRFLSTNAIWRPRMTLLELLTAIQQCMMLEVQSAVSAG